METNGKSSEPVNPFVPRAPKFEPPIEEVALEEADSGANSDHETDAPQDNDSADTDVLAPPALPCAGQLIVITGATGQLGQGLAQAFGNLGADLLLIGRDLSDLISTVESLDQPERAGVLACDLVSDSEVNSAVEFIAAAERPVSVLVHAAGLYEPSSVDASPVEDLDMHYLLNLRGPYLLTQKLLPLMTSPDSLNQDTVGGITMAGDAMSKVFFLLADQPEREATRGSGFAHVHVINAAVEAFTQELRVACEPRGIHVGVVTAELISSEQAMDTTEDVTPIVETLVDTIVQDGVGVQSLRVTSPRALRNV